MAITPTGLEIQTFETLRNQLDNDFKAYIDPELDNTDTTPSGQIINIFARQNALVWQALEIIFNQMNPDNAEGVLLDNICKLTGIVRRPATPSEVELLVQFGNVIVDLQPNVFYAQSDNSTERWTPKDGYVSSGIAGFASVTFVSENTGPIEANIGTITNISTPTFGVLSVDNLGQATPGTNREDDVSLRNRRAQSVNAVGSSTVDAITTDILALTDNDGNPTIIGCRTYEATTEPTEFVEEAHSFKCVVQPVIEDTETSNAIAQTIWNSKPAGIESLGDDSGTATDIFGVQHNVNFKFADNIPITITWEIEANDALNEDAMKEAFASYLRNKYTVGETISFKFVQAVPLNVYDDSLISDVISCTLQGGTSNIELDYFEVPIFDPSTMTITLA